MSIPEGYLPRKGDVVVLHAVVKYDVNPTEDADSEEGLQVWVTPKEYHSSSRVPLKTLVGVYSRYFEEGERVRFVNEPQTIATVLAICDEFVWLKTEIGGTYLTNPAVDLEPVPEPVVDTSDIPEAPESFFEKATFVEPEAESAAPSLRPESEDDIKF